MPNNPDLEFSRRERQIMEVLYHRGQASVADVAHEILNAPSASALRTLLSILERKVISNGVRMAGAICILLAYPAKRPHVLPCAT